MIILSGMEKKNWFHVRSVRLTDVGGMNNQWGFARPRWVRNVTIEAYWFSRQYVIQDFRCSLVLLGNISLSAVHAGLTIFFRRLFIRVLF